MKLRKVSTVTMAAVAFFVVAGAMAKARDSSSVLFPYEATVAGSRLASGRYNVQWETHSPAATVSFLRGSKIVATAEGKVVDRGTRYPSNEVMYNVGADGARSVQEIRFKGSSEVIVFQ